MRRTRAVQATLDSAPDPSRWREQTELRAKYETVVGEPNFPRPLMAAAGADSRRFLLLKSQVSGYTVSRLRSSRCHSQRKKLMNRTRMSLLFAAMLPMGMSLCSTMWELMTLGSVTSAEAPSGRAAIKQEARNKNQCNFI